VDLVGFGSANCAETAPTAALSNTTAALRRSNGCTDTGNNSADFSVAAPTPRNRATPLAPCSAPALPALSVADLLVAEGDSGERSQELTITLSAPAGTSGVSFDIATADGTATAGSDYIARSATLTVPAGATGAQFAVTLLGDTTVEADETFVVRISNVTGATVADAEAQITLANDDVIVTPIHELQGAGTVSGFDGQTVVTEGIVTARKSNGFFLQTADGETDGNPATSEGLFVFTGGTIPSAAQVGNRVRVSGRLVEFTPSSAPNQRPLTEITGGGGVSVQVSLRAAAQPLPAPVPLNLLYANPFGNDQQMERFEGMRVTTDPLVTVAPSSAFLSEPNARATGTDGVFWAVLAEVPRPFREPGINAADVIARTAPASIARFDGNGERIRIDSDGQTGAARVSADAGTALPALTGVLDYGTGAYTLLPDAGQLAGDAIGLLPGGRTPTAVADAPADAVTIGGFNLLRFFDDQNDPTKGEPVLTTAAFQGRLLDTSEAICTFVKLPDILGVVEVENLNALQQLADAINSNLSGQCAFDPQYEAHLLEGNDVGGIDVGVLVSTREIRPGTPRVRALSVTQHGKDRLFTNANGGTELLNDRPSLVVEAEVTAANGSRETVTVIINHLRSLIDVNSTDPGSQGWATAGDRVRAKRAAQALDLADLIHGRQQANPDERIVLLGDFNAFEFNDGLVDVMGIVTGREAGPAEVLLYADSPVTRPLTTLTTLAPADKRYSFTFEGNAQSLDHAVVNQAVLDQSVAVVADHAAINADFAEIRFGQGPVRVSDHDPVVVMLSQASFRTADLGVSLATPADVVAAGEPLSLTVSTTNAGPDEAVGARLTLRSSRVLAGATIAAANGWQCGTWQTLADAMEALCQRARIGEGTSATFTVTVPRGVTVAGQDLAITATVQARSTDSQPANNTATQRIVVRPGSRLSVQVATPAAQPLPGFATAEFTVLPRNDGPGLGAGGRLTLTFRGTVAMLGQLQGDGWACERQTVAANTARFDCTLGDAFPVGALPPLSLRVLPRQFSGEETVTLTAAIASNEPDPQPQDNAASASLLIRTARGR
jgi:predicted extracellular nuclease